MYSEYDNSWSRIAVTALHDFSSDELEYFERQYPEDLEHIFALHGPEMPLLIFTGTKDNRHVEEWQEHFALIERRIDFLFCLFFHVLVDQALHSTRRSERFDAWSAFRRHVAQPKLHGVLGTARSNISPFYLLTSAALWLDDETDADKKLIAYSRVFRHESEAQDIPYDFLVTRDIARVTQTFANHCSEFVRPYFRNQKPDMKLLGSWGSLLLREFGVTDANQGDV